MMGSNDLQEDGATESSAAERQFFGGSFYAKTIFDRHGIATSERSRLVERILGLAYSAAHRRVRGDTPWSVEDLGVLAKHFGESLDDVFISAAKARAESATFIAGELRLKCQLWLGAETKRPAAGGLVALKDGARWTVVPARDGLPGPLFDVRQVLLEPNATVGSRIAVLDDQPAITDSLCVFLSQAGFKADAFHSIGALQGTLANQSYDAYVLDWIIGEETVGALVEQLRASDPHCPIAILTGKANERGEVVADIADLVARHDVRYFSKPLDPRMITAVLSRLIAANARM